MKTGNQPTKEQVRQWLSQRRQNPAPIPNAGQIRKQRGWEQDQPARGHTINKHPGTHQHKRSG